MPHLNTATRSVHHEAYRDMFMDKLDSLRVRGEALGASGEPDAPALGPEVASLVQEVRETLFTPDAIAAGGDALPAVLTAPIGTSEEELQAILRETLGVIVTVRSFIPNAEQEHAAILTSTGRHLRGIGFAGDGDGKPSIRQDRLEPTQENYVTWLAANMMQEKVELADAHFDPSGKTTNLEAGDLGPGSDKAKAYNNVAYAGEAVQIFAQDEEAGPGYAVRFAADLEVLVTDHRLLRIADPANVDRPKLGTEGLLHSIYTSKHPEAYDQREGPDGVPIAVPSAEATRAVAEFARTLDVFNGADYRVLNLAQSDILAELTL
ncbi:MAG: hypothetical protein AAGK98_00760 [Pseudomonadota bacterium]